MNDRTISKIILSCFAILCLGLSAHFLHTFIHTEYEGSVRKGISQEEYEENQNFVGAKASDLHDQSLRKIRFQFIINEAINFDQIQQWKTQSFDSLTSINFKLIESFSKPDQTTLEELHGISYDLQFFLSDENLDTIYLISKCISNFLKLSQSKIIFLNQVLTEDSFNQQLSNTFKIQSIFPFEFVTTMQADDLTVTSGMHFFGFPDLYIQSQIYDPRQIDLLKNICHRLILDNKIQDDGSISIQLDPKISYQIPIKENYKPHKVKFHLEDKFIPWSGFNNRTIKIKFFKDRFTQNEAMIESLNTLFGKQVKQRKSFKLDADLQVAVFKVRSKIPYLKEKYLKDKLLLYVHIELIGILGGADWLWMRVTSWNNSTLEGILESKPTASPNLKVGSRVKVLESSLKDYRLYKDNQMISGELTKGLYQYN
ncbi:DUF4261 domain-containing protein [bacterium]|nr:DUF4261 domain-containing protein [bacterium]